MDWSHVGAMEVVCPVNNGLGWGVYKGEGWKRGGELWRVELEG